MSHYAQVIDNVVEQVIVAEQDFIDSGGVGDPKNWIQCSYNTRNNIHYDPKTNLPDNGTPLRGNYPAIGWIYDKEKDIFHAPKPYPSWIFNEITLSWDSPIPIPPKNESPNLMWVWNEPSLSWVEHTGFWVEDQTN